jgi:predicted lipid-binding transport protein (Tim44 family)
MSRYARRLGPAAGGLLLFLGLLTGCGNDSNNGSANQGNTPTPASTSASPDASSDKAACADIDTIKKSSDDLQTAVSKGDLTGAQTAYKNMVDAVGDLGNNVKAQGSAAAKTLHDTIEKVVGSASDMNSLAKLGAVAVALKAAGPAINNAVTTAKQNLTCPS